MSVTLDCFKLTFSHCSVFLNVFSFQRRVLRLTLLAGNGKKEEKTADTVSLKFLTVTFHNKAHRSDSGSSSFIKSS